MQNRNRKFTIDTTESSIKEAMQDGLKGVICESRMHTGGGLQQYYFYYADSFRGVVISCTKNRLFVEIGFLGNVSDYHLASALLSTLHRLTGAPVKRTEKSRRPFLLEKEIKRFISQDVKALRKMIYEEEELTLAGPFGDYIIDCEEVSVLLKDGQNAYHDYEQLEAWLIQPYLYRFQKLRDN